MCVCVWYVSLCVWKVSVCVCETFERNLLPQGCLGPRKKGRAASSIREAHKGNIAKEDRAGDPRYARTGDRRDEM